MHCGGFCFARSIERDFQTSPNIRLRETPMNPVRPDHTAQSPEGTRGQAWPQTCVCVNACTACLGSIAIRAARKQMHARHASKDVLLRRKHTDHISGRWAGALDTTRPRPAHRALRPPRRRAHASEIQRWPGTSCHAQASEPPNSRPGHAYGRLARPAHPRTRTLPCCHAAPLPCRPAAQRPCCRAALLLCCRAAVLPCCRAYPLPCLRT